MLLFDIGSNKGAWAFSNYNADTKIICVEAAPSTFDILKNKVNPPPQIKTKFFYSRHIFPASLRPVVPKYDNIICLNYAVTSSPEDYVDFHISEVDTISTMDIRWLNDSRSRFYNQFKFNTIRVKTITLDKLVELYGVPDILKVDVEGAENIVIKSLSSPAKTICFEWASEWYPETSECINHLSSLGYKNFHIQNKDDYLYRPPQYEHTNETLKDEIRNSKYREDWGMIWTTLPK